MLLKDLIQDIKKNTNMDNYQIAKETGVSYTTVTRWLNGSVDHLQTETAKRLSELVGKDVTQLLKNEQQVFTRPILGYTKAGYNLFLDTNYLGDYNVTYDDYKRGDYFLRVVGDSMVNAGISDGGLVYVEKCNQVENGQIAIVRVGDEVTVKRFMKRKDGFILRPENSYMEDKFFNKEDIKNLPVEILGKVLFFKIDLE